MYSVDLNLEILIFSGENQLINLIECLIIRLRRLTCLKMFYHFVIVVVLEHRGKKNLKNILSVHHNEFYLNNYLIEFKTDLQSYLTIFII